MAVVLATRSEDKAREIRQILAPVEGLVLVTLAELGLPPTPEEDELEEADNFAAIAEAKARYFARRTGMPTLADDSGLEVDALGGAPGVRTKRFSGRRDLTGKELDEANNQLLLERLKGVPEEQRTARYVCAAALALPAGAIATAIGTCEGRITTEPLGRGGFGYDPIFYSPELGTTVAMVSAEEKNRISHRARAFQALIPHIQRIVRP